MSLGVWVGKFGFYIDVMKFCVVVLFECVVVFYVKVLVCYGEVLDCCELVNCVKLFKDFDRFSCEFSVFKFGEFEYWVGMVRSFCVVSVKFEGDGSCFDMVCIDLCF